MAEEMVFFVKGLGSKKEVLEQANVRTARHVLVLANDPFDGELVQELQDPGAIEFAECIFSNQSKGN